MAAAAPRRTAVDASFTAPGAPHLRLDRFLRSLAEELSPTPGRMLSSVRMALVSALGAGIMAAMHIDTVLGLYVLWSIVSGPAAMMVPRTGLALIGAAGLALVASMPLAGILAEAPWILLTFFALFAGASTYFLTDAQLINGWRLVQILFLTSFWIVVFDPGGFGWSVAYAFSGTTVALVLIMLFDNVLWPDPAERRLLHLLASATEATRERLATVGRAYLQSAAALPKPLQGGTMSVHLALLSRADRETLSPRRHAVLLAALSVHERMRLEVERLVSIARGDVPRDIRATLEPELRAVLDAVDAALRVSEEQLRAGLPEPQAAPLDPARPIYASLEACNRRAADLRSQLAAGVRADELSNLGAFVLGLQRLARLFIVSPIPLPEAAAKRLSLESTDSADDLARRRYCLKLAAATALAFVVGLATHRSDLTTILWTVLIAGLPTFGASLRKMILRFAGAAFGGLVGLAAIIAASPNFETLPSYVTVCFAALLICAYVGLGGSRLGYAGKQAGITFVLIFVGLSPSVRAYEALWRLWGIFLGIIAVTVVFIVLWPEYAGESMVPRLEKMLEMICALMPPDGRALNEHEIESIQIDAAKTLEELLTVADDTRIEGGRSGFDPDAVVDTVGTLRRIAHRLGSIAGESGSAGTLNLVPEIRMARERLLEAFRAHFKACLDYVKHRAPREYDLPGLWKAAALGQLMSDFEERAAAGNFAATSSWSVETRIIFLAEMETFRRLIVLTGELSDQLVRVALPKRRGYRQPG